MTHLYIVRCNFTAPDKEQAWNDWYSGPKIKHMLAQPHFLSCQRFHRMAGSGRDYLALWTIATPEALRPCRTPRSGDLPIGRPTSPRGAATCSMAERSPRGDFAVARDGSLEVMSFDGMSADDMKATNAAIVQAGQGMMWLPVAGLDRHTPVIGFRVLPTQTSVDAGGASVQHAMYRPICDFQTAPLPHG